MTNKPIAELFDLTGKASIVTGGALGIGQAIAFRLSEAGARVMITDIDMEAANLTVEQIRKRDGVAKAICADAGSDDNATKVIETTLDAFGRLDILINNAGVYPISPAIDTSAELWDRTIDINLRGTFLYSQAVAREMIKAGRGGKIVNLSSSNALHPKKGLAHYAATKGGVSILTKALALEFAPHKILVNAVAPGGGIITPGTGAMEQLRLESGMTKKELEAFEEKRGARTPLGRGAEPDQIATVVLFLVSEAASYMTGSVVVVDGGSLLS